MEGSRERPWVLDWERMRGPDFEVLDRERAVVLVVCSPLEVHGPHLPVVTDICESWGLTEYAVDALHARHPELVFLRLPSLFVASDVVPQRGSVAFRSSTIERVLEDLGRSLAKQGFRHIWVSSFHGGPRHFVAIEAACARVNKQHDARMVSLFSLLLARLTGGATDLADLLGDLDGVQREDLRGDSHGGAVETSMMLHLMGAEVDEGYKGLARRTVGLKLEEAGKAPLQRGEKPTLWELLRGFKYKLKYYEDESYAGKPSVASAALGEAMLARLGGEAVEALDALWKGEIALGDCHSPLWRVRWLFRWRFVSWAFERLMRYKTQVW